MEADRKTMPGDTNMVPGPHFQEKTTYKVRSKVRFLGTNIFYSLELVNVIYIPMVVVFSQAG